ncbi:hypothetical protein PQ478_08455 [Alkalihalophilus pseudofirmus]|uniref:hypothetical protein n=1 Tax=Alkalihalophilus pseudofirmus TaxID=79885 RepID=UPI00259BCBB8|nr:hypothetical protein [Alkalihalophilus pseudofirmus]WEG18499.1 hypothetical protein PQ478_08455 [Alkalihalophilus pseudofirmus]
MAKAKKLTLKKIEQHNKDLDKRVPHTFEDGETLKYNPVFKLSTVEELINEYVNDIPQIQDLGIEIDYTYEQSYLMFLAIKYFTELGNDISEDIKEKIQQCNALIGSDYFYQMMEDMFDQDELMKIQDMFQRKVQAAEQMQRVQEQINQKMEKLDLKNREVIEKAFEQVKVKAETTAEKKLEKLDDELGAEIVQ